MEKKRLKIECEGIHPKNAKITLGGVDLVPYGVRQLKLSMSPAHENQLDLDIVPIYGTSVGADVVPVFHRGGMAVHTKEELIEKLAALEHEQWAHWTQYMLNNLTDENKDRWKRQITQSYGELPDKEKESDREWARKALSIFFEEETDNDKERI